MKDNYTEHPWEGNIRALEDENAGRINRTQVNGGTINNCLHLQTKHQSYFVKYNNASFHPGLFESERIGLHFLKSNSTFNIPQVFSTGHNEDFQWIIMTYVKSSNPAVNFWQGFGNNLAELHKSSSDFFGLEIDNYIGSLRQTNQNTNSWSDFFRDQRILPLLNLADKSDLIDINARNLFEKLLDNIGSFFPVEKPSALHGDLWSGNFMVDDQGRATIFDPAVYYGHREMDIGMTNLFGGFDQLFYDSYNKAFPLEPGWEERIEVANLYPLLVHLLLIGRSYLRQIKTILNRFT